MTRKQKRWREDFIVRIRTGGRLRGYDVRFAKGHAIPTKYFGFTRWGTLHEALKQARLYRDELVNATGEPPRRRSGRGVHAAPFHVQPTVRNTSGVVGVSMDHRGSSDGEWVAWYSPSPHKQKKRRFSIRKYGYEGALILASEWRAKMIAQLK